MSKQRKILVTGGAGFIGSHTCKRLAASGYLPVCLDNLVTGHADAVRWGPIVRADVRDSAAVAAALAAHDIDTVMHFAASAYVGESVREPGAYYDNNVGGMISLLQACRAAKVENFILSSSCATYGIPDSLPIRETAPQKPINPYGNTKLICEQMLADHGAAHGMEYVILRYFNAAGCDPDGELRERHDPETHLIPLALMAAAGSISHLDILGTDYDTPDGTCVRDYVHVNDLAAGHVAALAHLQNGKGNAAVNLGTGKGTSIRQIIAAIEVLTGRTLPVVACPRRPGDPASLVADPTRAREILGFAPKRSDIASIVRDAAPGFGLEVIHELSA